MTCYKNKKQERPVAFGLFVVVYVLLIIMWLNTMTGFILQNINYKHNQKLWQVDHVSGMINYQHEFGEYKMGFGDVAANGCGIIAIYNIMLLEGKPKALPDIIKFFEVSYLNFFGLGGTDPFGIKHYLSNQGFRVMFHTSKNKFREVAETSDYCLFCYIDKETGHYQLMFDFDGNTLQFVNINMRSSFDQFYNSIDTAFLKFMISVDR